jgi:DNA-binding transcriptional regulator GbsR (MarR family)
MYTEPQIENNFGLSQSEKDTSNMSDYTALPEMQKLAEQVGEFIHYWGFKRIHGKIWTHLFLAKQPLDAADLVREMKISKALVSISLRELLDFEVVFEAGKSERGTNLYRTNPDILAVILKVLREREKKMLHEVRNAFEQLSASPHDQKEKAGISPNRITQLSTLIQNAETSLESLIALKSVDFGPWREAFLTESEGDARPGPVPPVAVS